MVFTRILKFMYIFIIKENKLFLLLLHELCVRNMVLILDGISEFVVRIKEKRCLPDINMKFAGFSIRVRTLFEVTI